MDYNNKEVQNCSRMKNWEVYPERQKSSFKSLRLPLSYNILFIKVLTMISKEVLLLVVRTISSFLHQLLGRNFLDGILLLR